MNYVAVALALGVHAVLLVGMLPGCTPLQDSAPKNPAPPGELEVSIHLLPSDESPAEEGPPCEFYRGVGVITSFSGDVSEVAPGGPADKAGVLVGDVLLNRDEFSENRYEAGTPVVLHLDRNGQRLHLATTVRKICKEEKK